MGQSASAKSGGNPTHGLCSSTGWCRGERREMDQSYKSYLLPSPPGHPLLLVTLEATQLYLRAAARKCSAGKEPVSHFSFGLISPTRNPSWKTRIKKAYFLVWYKMKEKILFGWHIRVGLWKHLNNSFKKEQHENCSVVAGHSNWEWDEVSGNWIEAKRNKSPDPAKPPHTGAAIPMFYSDNEVWLGCCDYHLMSGLIS